MCYHFAITYLMVLDILFGILVFGFEIKNVYYSGIVIIIFGSNLSFVYFGQVKMSINKKTTPKTNLQKQSEYSIEPLILQKFLALVLIPLEFVFIYD